MKMLDLPRLTLITGGAASGKSRFAEDLMRRSGRAKVYVATAQIFDAEMRHKVEAHLVQRGADWRTIEAPEDIGAALQECAPDAAVLLDCATMWLSNRIFAHEQVDLAALLDALAQAPCPVVIVSNELGQGIVPENALARRFRNLHGEMNQRLGAEADWVFGVMAGLPFGLKGPDPRHLT